MLTISVTDQSSSNRKGDSLREKPESSVALGMKTGAAYSPRSKVTIDITLGSGM